MLDHDCEGGVEIAVWLRELRLERYEQAFRDNDIDAEILAELTEADLERLGIRSLGHRKRLLKAIAALRGKAASVSARTRIEAPTAERGTRPEPERRRLTVLFSDLVGSTALAARLDPEELGAVMGVYRAACAQVIGRWGGHVAKFLGDGVLAYFGWPQAHEDDAERALRAGLELVGQVADLEDPGGQPLACRVGIATGLVMVGELVGEGAAREESVVGETPNLAARLQALAAPGQVVIAEGTRRLVGAGFELEDLGARALKGFARPVPAFVVVGERAPSSRFEAPADAPAPMVGRAHELGLVLERWRRAADGEGQVVLLAGEPGIGKSRLVQAMRGAVAGEAATLALYCSPYHTSSPLHPVVDLLGRAAALATADPPATRLDKLEALLATAGADPGRAVPLLAALVGLDDDRRPAPNLTPQARKARTLEALADWIEGTAAGQPLLLILENAHWLDPTSGELIDLLVERLAQRKILLVITYRPELAPRWAGFAHATSLSLSRLGRGDAAAIARRVGDALPESVVAEIVARTDGVPLFVEELAKAMLEAVKGRVGDRLGERTLGLAAVPATLHDALLARLDRLGPAKAVAQTAAVIGREFAYPLLAAVLDLPEGDLTAALDQIVATELIFRRGTPPEATYVFKHALVRDAAYESLLKSRRCELHARVAEALRLLAETRPEVLAHHLTEAGLVQQAADNWYRAGQEAIARSAMSEAVAQLIRGIDAVAGLPDDPERQRLELDLQTALGSALIAAQGYAAPATGHAFARARTLCQETGDAHRLMPVLNGLMLFHFECAEVQAADQIAAEMMQLAQDHGDPALRIPACRARSLIAFEVGRFAEARDQAEQVLRLYDPARHPSLAHQYSFDQRAVALGYLASALLLLGHADRARRYSEQHLAEARALGHPATLAQAVFYSCLFHRRIKSLEELHEAAEGLVAFAGEQELPFFAASARLMRGFALACSMKAMEGVEEIKQVKTAFEADGTRLMLPYVHDLLAEAFLTIGWAEQALEHARAALATREDIGPSWCDAERHRCHGRALLTRPEPDWPAAEACFRRALAIARKQEARMWELRAATSLAGLWSGQGRRAEARDLLAPVYEWFTEGFDTPDLIEAKALLDGLR